LVRWPKISNNETQDTIRRKGIAAITVDSYSARGDIVCSISRLKIASIYYIITESLKKSVLYILAACIRGAVHILKQLLVEFLQII